MAGDYGGRTRGRVLGVFLQAPQRCLTVDRRRETRRPCGIVRLAQSSCPPDNAASIVRDISKKQQQVEDNLRGEINDLSRRIESVHSAFVEKLEELAEEGRVLIGGRDFPAIERWITKANYVVRSLIIPTEERLLRDTSVVKEDLRDAMIEFDRAQDDNAKLAQARRVLVIVEAVCELAVGGRIP